MPRIICRTLRCLSPNLNPHCPACLPLRSVQCTTRAEARMKTTQLASLSFAWLLSGNNVY